jgi:hypothetical protein
MPRGDIKEAITLEQEKLFNNPELTRDRLDQLEEALNQIDVKGYAPLKNLSYERIWEGSYKLDEPKFEFFERAIQDLLEVGAPVDQLLKEAIKRYENSEEVVFNLPIDKPGKPRIYDIKSITKVSKDFTLKSLEEKELITVLAKSKKLGTMPGDIYDIKQYHTDIQEVWKSAKSPEHFISLLASIGKEAKELRNFTAAWQLCTASEQKTLLKLLGVGNILEAPYEYKCLIRDYYFDNKLPSLIDIISKKGVVLETELSKFKKEKSERKTISMEPFVKQMAFTENVNFPNYVPNYYRENPEAILYIAEKVKFTKGNQNSIKSFMRSFDYYKKLSKEDQERVLDLIEKAKLTKIFKKKEEFDSLFEKPEAKTKRADKNKNKKPEQKPVVKSVDKKPSKPASSGETKPKSTKKTVSKSQKQRTPETSDSDSDSEDSGIELVLPKSQSKKSDKNKVPKYDTKTHVSINGTVFERRKLRKTAEQSESGAVLRLKQNNVLISRRYLLRALDEKWTFIYSDQSKISV